MSICFLVVQVALVIRGFVIRGFDYPRPLNCVQNSISADFAIFNAKRALKGQNSDPLLFVVLVFA